MIFSVHHLFGYFHPHLCASLFLLLGEITQLPCMAGAFWTYLFIWVSARERRTTTICDSVGCWSNRPMISKIFDFFLLILAFLIYFFRFVERSFWLWPLIDLHSIDQQQNTQNWIVYVYDGHRMADRVSFAQRYRRVKHSSWSHLKTDLSTYLARWRWRKRIWRSEMETHNEWRTHIDRNWSRNRLCRSSSSS